MAGHERHGQHLQANIQAGRHAGSARGSRARGEDAVRAALLQIPTMFLILCTVDSDRQAKQAIRRDNAADELLGSVQIVHGAAALQLETAVLWGRAALHCQGHGCVAMPSPAHS